MKAAAIVMIALAAFPLLRGAQINETLIEVASDADAPVVEQLNVRDADLIVVDAQNNGTLLGRTPRFRI